MAQPATVVVNVNDVQALRALDNIARKFNDVGRRMQAIGLQTGAIGAAITAPFAAATTTFAKFDTTLRTIQGVTGATDAQMAELRKTVSSITDDIAPRDAVAEMEELERHLKGVSSKS